MKKLKIKQPFAQLIVNGALSSLQGLVKDLEVIVGERIYIYANGLDKSFSEGYNFNNPQHRKVYNEMFFGNINQKCFTDEKGFIGYITIGSTGKIYPYKISNVIENFDADFKELISLKANSTTAKRLSCNRNRLYVPINKAFWLSKISEGYRMSIFWEDYMCEIINNHNDIDEVVFQQSNKDLRFGTYLTGWNCLTLIGGENYEMLTFGLEEFIDGGYLIPIEEYVKLHIKNTENNPTKDDIDDDSVETEYKYKHPFVRIIYTAMESNRRKH